VTVTCGKFDGVRQERRGHVSIITLARPRVLNAISSAVSRAVGAHLEQADCDPEVRAIILTGTGRAFCAGADLRELADGASIHDPDHPEWGFAGVTRHWVDTPLIAAVNGLAFGGGAEIALACDLVVADRDATFALPEVARGLIAGAGGLIRLPRQTPIKRALELALTGEPIDAVTAQAWGLVNRVVDTGDALPAAIRLAERIAANAPIAVAQSKRVIHATAHGGSEWRPEWSGDDVWALGGAASRAVRATGDADEGPRAFEEKRPPVWRRR
jgi:crotonobetainyl-CoA hydratase